MENYKVKVNSEAESKEVQGLFFELGLGWLGSNFDYVVNRVGLFYTTRMHDRHIITLDPDCDSELPSHKELTIPQLRDMVVLKRNDVNDATHVDQYGDKWVCIDNVWYFYTGMKKWDSFSGGEFMSRYDLKPITKAETIMKEFLVKNQNDEYVLLNDVSRIPSEFVVEVPEGADKATLCGDYLIYWKGSNLSFSIKEECEWCCAKKHPNSFFQFDEYMSGHKDALVIWQRDAPSVEKTVSSNLLDEKYPHYDKDVSHLDKIDVYRVLELFGVKSHAVGHAIKKLLCSGQRGAKDESQDIQEAIDSLNRELEMMKEDEF